MPTDDPFARADVRALCEAVAAGDDPAAAAVLADVLDEAGANRVALLLRQHPPVVQPVDSGGWVWVVRFSPGTWNVVVNVYPDAEPKLQSIGRIWPEVGDTAYALALAAGRLAVRAAAK